MYQLPNIARQPITYGLPGIIPSHLNKVDGLLPRVRLEKVMTRRWWTQITPVVMDGLGEFGGIAQE